MAADAAAATPKYMDLSTGYQCKVKFYWDDEEFYVTFYKDGKYASTSTYLSDHSADPFWTALTKEDVDKIRNSYKEKLPLAIKELAEIADGFEHVSGSIEQKIMSYIRHGLDVRALKAKIPKLHYLINMLMFVDTYGGRMSMLTPSAPPATTTTPKRQRTLNISISFIEEGTK